MHQNLSGGGPIDFDRLASPVQQRIEDVEKVLPNVATKDDIESLKKEMSQFVLKSDFASLKKEMVERFACKSDIEILRTELKYVRWVLTAGVSIGLAVLTITTIIFVNSVELVIR